MSADGWRLLKDGEPFYVQGAVGWNRFDVLRRAAETPSGQRRTGRRWTRRSGKGWP
jgi:hypothetical protein